MSDARPASRCSASTPAPRSWPCLRSIGSPAEMLRAYPAISAKQSTITRAEVIDVDETHGLISVVTPNHTRDRAVL